MTRRRKTPVKPVDIARQPQRPERLAVRRVNRPGVAPHGLRRVAGLSVAMKRTSDMSANQRVALRLTAGVFGLGFAMGLATAALIAGVVPL